MVRTEFLAYIAHVVGPFGPVSIINLSMWKCMSTKYSYQAYFLSCVLMKDGKCPSTINWSWLKLYWRRDIV